MADEARARLETLGSLVKHHGKAMRSLLLGACQSARNSSQLTRQLELTSALALWQKLMDAERDHPNVEAPATTAEQLERWIPCSERMPPGGRVVIAFDAMHHRLLLCWRAHDQSCWFPSEGLARSITNVDLTHWMPLPSPPKEHET